MSIETPKGFKEKIREWFADDPKLLHAPRLFDPDFKNEPPQFIKDGLIDERDGQQYDIIIVNNVSWMAEGLHYCDGAHWDCARLLPLPFLAYTWQAAMNVCPPDWRLPDETDFKTLYLGLGLPLENVDRFVFDKEGYLGKKMLIDSFLKSVHQIITNSTIQLNKSRSDPAYAV